MAMCAPPHRQAGAALLELAIFIPLMLFLGLAIVEASRSLIAYTNLVNQARIAARLLSTRAPGDGHLAARCLAVYGASDSSNCTGTPVLPGLSLANVTVLDASIAGAQLTHRMQRTGTDSGATSVNVVTVTISGYQHQLIILSFIGEIYNNQPSITFQPIAVSMRHQL